ncbi:unnamed protein product [Moneuplotes crassus]|uniref:CSC1/OSCA1-like cytosolic domain-containing protein n=1 Tax=Euplotes crassus TaxID=5936 RepID=A0AAD1Y012_EUPCR|nr:unnamed protein product [Moneuplotes crassus]
MDAVSEVLEDLPRNHSPEKDSLSISDGVRVQEESMSGETNRGNENNVEDLQPEEEHFLDKIPPDFDIAEKHRESCRIRRINKVKIFEQSNNSAHFCSCCNLPTKEVAQKFSVCAKSSELEAIGIGFGMLYRLKMFHLVIYFVLGVMGSTFSLRLILQSEGSAGDFNNAKDVSFLSRISLGEFGKYPSSSDKDNIGSISNLYLFLILLISVGIIGYKLYQNQTIKKKSKNHTKASDFGVIATNLTKDTSKDQIKNWLMKQNSHYEIVYIEMCKDIKDPVKITKRIDKLKNRKRAFELYNKKLLKLSGENEDQREVYPPPKKWLCITTKKYGEINKEIKNIEEEIEKLEREKEELEEDLKFCGTAIIMFDKIDDVEIITKNFKITWIGRFALYIAHKLFNSLKRVAQKECILDDRRIFIESPPESNDLIWENLSTRKRLKVTKAIKTYAITAFCLLIAGGINYLLNKLRDQVSGTEQTNPWVFIVTLITMLCVAFTNQVLCFIIRKISVKERHNTHTSYNLSVAQKLAIASLINTGISPLLVNFGKDNWFHSNGLVVDVVSNTLSVCFFNPLMYLCDPKYFYKKWLACVERKKETDSLLTQRQVNDLFEGPQVDIALQHSNLMLLLCLVLMYCYVFPIVAVIAIFGALFQYFIEKYLLLNRHKLPPEIGPSLSQFFIGVMPVLVAIFGCSIFFSNSYLFGINYWRFIVVSILALIYFAFPIPDCLIRSICDYRKDSQLRYHKEKHKFLFDYNRANPAADKSDGGESNRENEDAENCARQIDQPEPSNVFTRMRKAMFESPDSQNVANRISNYALYGNPVGGGQNSFPLHNFSYISDAFNHYAGVATHVSARNTEGQNPMPTLVPDHNENQWNAINRSNINNSLSKREPYEDPPFLVHQNNSTAHILTERRNADTSMKELDNNYQDGGNDEED